MACPLTSLTTQLAAKTRILRLQQAALTQRSGQARVTKLQAWAAAE